jgi:hypothetical protein
MNVEQVVVPGVVTVMVVFMLVLGGAAFLTRDRK